ncbi:hypothetical protein TNCV_2165251 [Trichonephila clavipes]|nr:hypothetical protein TNCV_2165251 [Trichonephila clavipes]
MGQQIGVFTIVELVHSPGAGVSLQCGTIKVVYQSLQVILMPSFFPRGKYPSSDPKPYTEFNFSESTQAKQFCRLPHCGEEVFLGGTGEVRRKSFLLVGHILGMKAIYLCSAKACRQRSKISLLPKGAPGTWYLKKLFFPFFWCWTLLGLMVHWISDLAAAGS